MRITKETELNKLLKEKGRQGLYLLWGSEEFLIQNWTKKIVQPFAQQGDFNYTELEGADVELNDLYDAVQQLPVFAPQRCVLLKDLDVKKLLKEDIQTLIEIFESLPLETVLVVSCRVNSLEARSANGKKLIKSAQENGVSVEFSARDQAGLVNFLQSRAISQGCKLDANNAREIIRLCGNEMLILQNELDKLCAYVGQGDIAQSDIEKVVIAKIEERVFDLGRMILAGNTQRAFEILSGLFYQRESPIAIVATLVMSYTDIYRAQIAKRAGKNANEAAAMFSYRGREFRMRNAFGVKISKTALEKSLDILYDTEKKLKSTGLEPNTVLEHAVMELIAVRNIQ